MKIYHRIKRPNPEERKQALLKEIDYLKTKIRDTNSMLKTLVKWHKMEMSRIRNPNFRPVFTLSNGNCNTNMSNYSVSLLEFP